MILVKGVLTQLHLRSYKVVVTTFLSVPSIYFFQLIVLHVGNIVLHPSLAQYQIVVIFPLHRLLFFLVIVVRFFYFFLPVHDTPKSFVRMIAVVLAMSLFPSSITVGHFVTMN